MINIIVAVSRNGVIGNNNDLVWNLPDDLKRFKKLTMGNTIIMGRRTHESIGRPLPGRLNIVVTRSHDFCSIGCIIVDSIEEALMKSNIDSDIYIIGGGEIYRQVLKMGIIDNIYLTLIDEDFEGDTTFEYNENEYIEVSRVNVKSSVLSYDNIILKHI